MIVPSDYEISEEDWSWLEDHGLDRDNPVREGVE